MDGGLSSLVGWLYLQMQHDPLDAADQRFWPLLQFFLPGPTAGGISFRPLRPSTRLLPPAIILDLTPLHPDPMLLEFRLTVMNQVPTLHGLNTYLEATGFHRLPALSAHRLGGFARRQSPNCGQSPSRRGKLGGPVWRVCRWSQTAGSSPGSATSSSSAPTGTPPCPWTGDAPGVSNSGLGVAATDASAAVNMAFRNRCRAREDCPLDAHPHSINLHHCSGD